MHIRLGVALVVGLAIWWSPQATGQSDLVAQLRKEIPEREKLLLNLRVDGKSESELWDVATKGWKNSGEMEVTAWYMGAPGGKVRVDFHKQITAWTEGAAPFFQEAFTVAYNGRASQKLHKTGGPPERQHDDLRGEVQAERDKNVQVGNWASGWAYSLYGFLDHKGLRLSSIFDSKDLVVVAQEAEYGGVKSIQLKASGPREYHTWYLDPARGYAILGYERATPQPPYTVSTQLTVEQLVEAAPGVYYPTKGFAEGFLPDGTPFTRSQYEASMVLANDPGFSEDVFTIKWPSGAVVEDKIANRVFVVPPEKQRVNQNIHEPAPPSNAASSSGGQAHSAAASPTGMRVPLWTLVAGTGIAVILVIALPIHLGRKK